jgi:hypothetical protein
MIAATICSRDLGSGDQDAAIEHVPNAVAGNRAARSLLPKRGRLWHRRRRQSMPGT